MPNAPKLKRLNPIAPKKDWDSLTNEQKVSELIKAGELEEMPDGSFVDEAGHIHSSIEDLKDEGVI